MRMVMRERIRGMGCAPVIWPMLIGIALMVGCGGEKVENGPLGSEEDASAQDTVVFADAGLEGAVRAALAAACLVQRNRCPVQQPSAVAIEAAKVGGLPQSVDANFLNLCPCTRLGLHRHSAFRTAANLPRCGAWHLGYR